MQSLPLKANSLRRPIDAEEYVIGNESDIQLRPGSALNALRMSLAVGGVILVAASVRKEGAFSLAMGVLIAMHLATSLGVAACRRELLPRWDAFAAFLGLAVTTWMFATNSDSLTKSSALLFGYCALTLSGRRYIKRA